MAELLVRHGASVNVADLWKFTPLHEAAAKGKYEICKLLLKVRRRKKITMKIRFDWLRSAHIDGVEMNTLWLICIAMLVVSKELYS